MSIREDPSGSIKGFEQGRGTGYPSLPLCLIEEALFGAAIHNFLRLIRSQQSGRHQVFHFSPAWGTYESKRAVLYSVTLKNGCLYGHNFD